MMSQATAQQCIEEVDEPLIKLPKGKLIFFMAILYVLFLFDFIIRYGVNAILPLIQDDLGISASQIGLLGSAVFFGMAVFVMPISFVGENISQRRAISFCSIIWSAATMVCGMASSATSLIINRFLVGSGNSAYAPLSTAMLTSWFKKSSWGKVLGLFNTAMALGGACGFVIFAALAQQFGWRASFYIIGGVSFAFALLSLLLPDNKKLMAQQGAKEGANNDDNEIAQIKLNLKDTAKLVIKNKALLTMCLAAGLGVFASNVTSTFISIYYVKTMGMSLTTAAGIVALGTPISLVAMPLGGAILDKWYKKDRRARMWMPLVCIAITGILYVLGYTMQIIPLILCAGAIYSVGSTSFHTACHELVPAWYKSISYGTYVLFIQLLGAFGPACGGFIVDAFGIQNALVYVQGVLIVSVLLLLYAGKIYLKYYNAARAEEEAKGLCPSNH